MNSFPDDVASELDIEPTEKDFNEEEKKLIGLCWSVFHKSDDGRKLLNMLEERYNRNPVANPNLSPNFAYFKEGERNMLRMLRQYIEIQKSILLKNER